MPPFSPESIRTTKELPAGHHENVSVQVPHLLAGLPILGPRVVVKDTGTNWAMEQIL